MVIRWQVCSRTERHLSGHRTVSGSLWIRAVHSRVAAMKKSSCRRMVRGWSAVCSSQKENGVWNFYSESGEKQGALDADAVDLNRGSGLAFCKNGKWGFATNDGNVAIEPEYDKAKSFFRRRCSGVYRWQMGLHQWKWYAGDRSSSGRCVVF